MHVPFEQLSSNACIWIYTADRLLSEKEREKILESTLPFLATWAPHNSMLQCAADILYHRFLILAAEKNGQPLSCCTGDSIIQLIHNLQQQFCINFLDRTQVIFKNGGEIFFIPIHQIQESIRQKIIKENTMLFDTAITQKKTLMDAFIIEVKNSWVYKYF